MYSRVHKVRFALWGHRAGRGYSRVSLCCSASTRAALVPRAQVAQHSLGADLTVNLLLLGAQRGALIKPAGPAESLAEMKGSRRQAILTGAEGVKHPLPSGAQNYVWMMLDVSWDVRRVCVCGHVAPSREPASTPLLWNAHLCTQTWLKQTS